MRGATLPGNSTVELVDLPDPTGTDPRKYLRPAREAISSAVADLLRVVDSGGGDAGA